MCLGVFGCVCVRAVGCIEYDWVEVVFILMPCPKELRHTMPETLEDGCFSSAV